MSDYMLDYISRINASGENIAESQFNTTANFIESSFADSPSYFVVRINSQDVGVRLTDLSPIVRGNMELQSTRKIMLLKPRNKFNPGTIVLVNGENWMITDFNDNDLFPQARIDKCNSSITVKTVSDSVIGVNPFTGQPVEATSTTSETTYPCVVVKAFTNESLNQPVNIDRDSVFVTLPYFDFKDKDFVVFDEKYIVKSIDKTKSNQGIMVILGERSTK